MEMNQINYWIRKNTLKIILGITFTLSIGFNIKFAFNQNTTTTLSPAITTKGNLENNEFIFDGRKYTNTTINYYTINSNGELKVSLSAIDPVTGDSVEFASEATVKPAKWDKAIWGQNKWE